MKNSVSWATLVLIISGLISCSRGTRPELTVSSFPTGIESGFFAPGESYRAELQGKIQGEWLETQTITVSHEKQSQIATELAEKLTQESTQAQQQLDDLLEKDKQLQQALRKKK
jgi:hypothetical protein